MIRNHLKCLFLSFLAGAFLLSSSIPADARGKKKPKKAGQEEVEKEPPKPVWPSPLDPGIHDPAFKELPFGLTRENFLEVLFQRFQEQLKPILRATLNAHERDNLKAKMEKTFTEVKETYTPLDGKSSGYAISVVSDEFRPGADESLYKYAFSDNAAYFFFSGNKFYKMFLCSDGERDFTSLLVQLATRYGDPMEIIHEDDEKTVPIMALWRDTTFQLRASRPEGIFRCSRLVWTYLPTLPEVEERRAKVEKNPTESGTSGMDFINQITQDSKQDPDVMDKILDKRNDKSD